MDLARPDTVRPASRPAARSHRAAVLAGLLLLAMLAIVLPPLGQHPHYHEFVDQRRLLGIPNAMDVLTNLPFALVGLGILMARRRGLGSPVERTMLGMVGVGLLLTAAGSAAYHLRPADPGLLLDRAGMAVAFAGLLGLAGCRLGAGEARLLAAGTALGAVAALAAWRLGGNLAPWSVLQAGGVAALGVMASLRAPQALPVRWLQVVALYALAKGLELGDHAVWQLSHGWVGGHALKHLAAAAATLPVLRAMRAG